MKIKIRDYNCEDLKKVASLISTTFKMHNFADNDSQAAKAYYQFYNPNENTENEISKVFDNADIFLVAESNGKIIGEIRGSFEQIKSLFVLTKFQKTGIGKKLVEAFEHKTHVDILFVNSQISSVDFYKTLGFISNGSEKLSHGLRIVPMEKTLK